MFWDVRLIQQVIQAIYYLFFSTSSTVHTNTTLLYYYILCTGHSTLNIITSPSWGARHHVSHACELRKLETAEFLGLYCLSPLINSANSAVIMRSLSKPVTMWHIPPICSSPMSPTRKHTAIAIWPYLLAFAL